MAAGGASVLHDRGEDAGNELRLIVIIGALSAFAPLSIDMYLPALPALGRDMSASASSIQFTLTGCLLGLALGQLVAGPISDARGRRGPLLVGLVVYVGASLGCVLAPSVGLLVVLRILQGLGGAAGLVIARAVVRDLHTGMAAARFLALTSIVNGLAPILAPVVGGQILRVTTWRGVFVALATIGVGLFLTAWFGMAETLPHERRQGGGLHATLRTFGTLAHDRALVGYALCGGFGFAAMFAYISASPFVLEDIHHISPQMFSLIFGVNALGIMLASQATARLVLRVPLRRLLAAGLGLSVAGAMLLLISIPASGSLLLILPGYFLVASAVGLILPNAIALALAAHGRTAGSASALIGVGQYVIGGAVAPLVGVAGTATSVPMSLVIASCSVAAVLTFLVAPPEQTEGRCALLASPPRSFLTGDRGTSAHSRAVPDCYPSPA